MITKREIDVIVDKNTHISNVVIISHFNPDGDAMGSSLALYHFYRNNGCHATVILPNSFPRFLSWMPGSKEILIAEKEATKARKAVEEADMIYIVDMNAPHRAGSIIEKEITRSKAFKILIDHHVQPDIECDILYSIPKASSTSELIYIFLFEKLKQKNALTLEMAECLYTGIITDTGSLTYGCNNPKTYIILSKLIKKGVDGEQLHRCIYDSYGESRIHLLGLALSQRMKIFHNYATSYTYLSKKDLSDNQYQIGDTEGFVNYGLAVKGIQFTAIFIQQEKRVRISFRSKGSFDVNDFARKHFNGGGHRNASAAYHQDTLNNTITYFESLLPQYQEELCSLKQKNREEK